MLYTDMQFLSSSLGMNTRVLALIPQDRSFAVYGKDKNRFRVLYLLHGFSGDETCWMRLTSIERYAERYGIAVIMPRADRYYYCNFLGCKYYDYISSELNEMIPYYFNVSDQREDTYVAGLSMGGYGALKLALRSPEKYRACAALSPVTDWAGASKGMPEVIGEDYVCPPEDDLYHLAANYPASLQKPEIFIGCGTEDVLYPHSTAFRDELKKLGYPLTYRESHGIHNWDFWDEYIVYALGFFFENKA